MDSQSISVADRLFLGPNPHKSFERSRFKFLDSSYFSFFFSFLFFSLLNSVLACLE
ncbi:unnamed protein product [Arabidopsis halleri]